MQNFNVILTKEQIEDKIKEIAEHIDNDFRDKKFYALVFSKQSFIFASDLFRNIKSDICVDFVFNV